MNCVPPELCDPTRESLRRGLWTHSGVLALKVLMQSRPDLFDIPGGDTIQLLKTKEYLEKAGLHVDVSLQLRPCLKHYDLVHLFNITRVHETFVQATNVMEQGKRFVLSPIYWDFTEFNQKGRTGLRKYVFRMVRNENILETFKGLIRILIKPDLTSLHAVLCQWKNGFVAQQVFVLNSATSVLPNSAAEAELLNRKFGSQFDLRIVYNAADRLFAEKASPEVFLNKFGLNDFVLCVGRFDERKNQLALIRAMQDTNVPLVFVGSFTPSHLAFYKKCRRHAAGSRRIKFIKWLDHSDLRHAYSAAKVHALPSWLETPGLSSLEAALSGCNVVVTDRGSTKEYFRDLVWYCEPADVASIRERILSAYEAPRRDALRQHVLMHFTWERTAESTIDAYKSALEGG